MERDKIDPINFQITCACGRNFYGNVNAFALHAVFNCQKQNINISTQ